MLAPACSCRQNRTVSSYVNIGLVHDSGDFLALSFKSGAILLSQQSRLP